MLTKRTSLRNPSAATTPRKSQGDNKFQDNNDANGTRVVPTLTQQLRETVVVPVLRFVKIIMTWTFCIGVLFNTKFASFLISSVRSFLGYAQQVSTSPLNSNSFACLVQYPVYVTFVVYTGGMIPITLLCIVTLYLATKKKFKWPMSIYSSTVCCLALLYPQVVVSVIQILQCDVMSFPLWGDGSLSTIKPHTYNLLRADRRISCDGSNSEYQSYRIAAIIVAVVYGLGFPLTCIVMHRYVPKEIFNFLSKDVRPEAWWWELFVMSRKALLQVCVSIVPVEDLQIICYIAVLFCVLGIFVPWKPYEDSVYNVMELLSITSCCIVAVLLGFLGHYHNNEDNDAPWRKLAIQICIVTVVTVVGVVYVIHTISILISGIKRFIKTRKANNKVSIE